MRVGSFVFFFVDVDAVDWQVGCICGGSGWFVDVSAAIVDVSVRA